MIAGSGTADAAVDGLASEVFLAELGPVEIGRWTAALAPASSPELPDSDIVVLPHAPDGRDLAPRLAAALERPLLAGATEVARAPRPRRPPWRARTPRAPTRPARSSPRCNPAPAVDLTLDAPPEVHHLDLAADSRRGGRRTRRPRGRGVAARRADDGPHRSEPDRRRRRRARQQRPVRCNSTGSPARSAG